MIDDGLYNLVPAPDLMLAQHVVPSATGSVSIRSSPVLVAADSIRVRVVGGPCEGTLNPQQCVDPIPIAMRVILGLEDAVRAEIGPGKDATVACWGFHAGEPGNDHVAYADFLLDVKTMEVEVRLQVREFIKRQFREARREAGMPREPIFDIKVRAPLTSNDVLISDAVGKVFKQMFGDNALEMELTRACEDFSTLGGGHNVPYAYWNFGGSGNIIGGCRYKPLPLLCSHYRVGSPHWDRCYGTGCTDVSGQVGCRRACSKTVALTGLTNKQDFSTIKLRRTNRVKVDLKIRHILRDNFVAVYRGTYTCSNIKLNQKYAACKPIFLVQQMLRGQGTPHICSIAN